MFLADWNLFLRKKFLPLSTFLFLPGRHSKLTDQEAWEGIQGPITDQQKGLAPLLVVDSDAEVEQIKREHAACRAKITHVRLQASQEYLESTNHP